MSYVCLTVGEQVQRFSSMGFETLEIEQYLNIPSGIQVIVIDPYSTIDVDILSNLIDKGCDIFYITEEQDSDTCKYLYDQREYNIYSGKDIESLDVSTILEILKTKRVKGEVRSSTGSQLAVGGLYSIVNSMQKFMEAIDSKDEETLTNLFNRDFDKYLRIEELINTNLNELNKLKRSDERNLEDIKTKELEITRLKQKLNSLINHGEVSENKNNELTERIIQLESELNASKELNKRSRTTVEETADRIRELIEESKRYKTGLDEAKVLALSYKTKLEDKTKEVYKLSSALTKVAGQGSDTEIKLNKLDTVKNLLYVKMIDPIPYVVSTFKLYQGYNKSKNGKSTGLLLVGAKGNALTNKYQNDHNVVGEPEVDYYKTSDEPYVLKQYSIAVKDYLDNCNCETVIILDLSYSDEIFIESVSHKTIYGVNSSDTIERFNLFPKDCFSQTKLDGVTSFIPYNEEYNEKMIGAHLLILINSIYNKIDSLWW